MRHPVGSVGRKRLLEGVRRVSRVATRLLPTCPGRVHLLRLAYNPPVLQQPPAHAVLIDEELEYGAGGFVRLVRRQCRLRYASGEHSRSFTYDAAERRAFDAAVVVAYFELAGEPQIFFRSCVRPPISFRAAKFADAPDSSLTNLWELPAGLIDETGEVLAAARQCAARELQEEAGLIARAEDFSFLGGPTLPLPGVIAERQYFLAVRVEPANQGTPSEDGSPLEGQGLVITLALSTALQACHDGRICDGKTELGLRRFQDSWHARK